MKNSTKAAIYSATLAPGAGLFFLRHHLLGLVFLLPSLLALFFLMRHYFAKTQRISELVVTGKFPLDISAMVAEVLQETDPAVLTWIWQLKGVFIAIWLASIIASAIAGHLQDKKTIIR